MNLHRSVPMGEAARRRQLLEAEACHSETAVAFVAALIRRGEEAIRVVANESIAAAATLATLTEIAPRHASQTDSSKLLDSLHDADIAHGGLGLVLARMRAYAYYGIALCGDRTIQGRRSVIHCSVRWDGDYLRERAEGDDLWWMGIEDMLSAAEGRWQLENSEPIHPRALANLGGVSERHVQKMMWEAGTPFSGLRYEIPAEPALAWLLDRPDVFYSSIWLDQDAFTDLPIVWA